MQKQDSSAKKEIAILDPKRSNVINIGLTVLPPPRTIKTAILKMDSAIMNREGIEVYIIFIRMHFSFVILTEANCRVFICDQFEANKSTKWGLAVLNFR